MSRIDDDDSRSPWLTVKDEREKLKDEIRHELVLEEKSKKRKKLLLSCGAELLFVLVILGFLATGIAKTGLVDIPIFTKIFYHLPVPQKIVSILPSENPQIDFEKKLEEQTLKQIKQNNDADTLEFDIAIGEKELTSLLKEKLVFDPKDSQISIVAKQVELFGKINSSKKIYLTFGFLPKIDGNKIKIETTNLKIGTLPLPRFIGNIIVKIVLNNQINIINETIGKAGTIKSIDLFDNGELKIKSAVDAVMQTE